jgi:hypothetical protein
VPAGDLRLDLECDNLTANSATITTLGITNLTATNITLNGVITSTTDLYHYLTGGEYPTATNPSNINAYCAVPSVGLQNTIVNEVVCTYRTTNLSAGFCRFSLYDEFNNILATSSNISAITSLANITFGSNVNFGSSRIFRIVLLWDGSTNVGATCQLLSFAINIKK